MAQRIAEQADAKLTDSRESFDISTWLLEADQVDRRVAPSEPDTRQIKMEETSQLDTEMLQEAVEAAESEDANAPADAVVAAEESTKLKRPDKRAPIKLPKIQGGPTTKNTKDAASETLKRYFGGR